MLGRAGRLLVAGGSAQLALVMVVPDGPVWLIYLYPSHGERAAAFDSKGTFGCGPLSRWVLTRIGNAAGGHKILMVVGDRI